MSQEEYNPAAEGQPNPNVDDIAQIENLMEQAWLSDENEEDYGWQCEQCTFLNTILNEKCDVCQCNRFILKQNENNEFINNNENINDIEFIDIIHNQNYVTYNKFCGEISFRSTKYKNENENHYKNDENNENDNKNNDQNESNNDYNNENDNKHNENNEDNDDESDENDNKYNDENDNASNNCDYSKSVIVNKLSNNNNENNFLVQIMNMKCNNSIKFNVEIGLIGFKKTFQNNDNNKFEQFCDLFRLSQNTNKCRNLYFIGLNSINLLKMNDFICGKNIKIYYLFWRYYPGTSADLECGFRIFSQQNEEKTVYIKTIPNSLVFDESEFMLKKYDSIEMNWNTEYSLLSFFKHSKTDKYDITLIGGDCNEDGYINGGNIILDQNYNYYPVFSSLGCDCDQTGGNVFRVSSYKV